ncbi:helix-turn-helix domain-containing protein [uncultured Dokdonia sp.]|uniref:helix-turn-helix domain-containing protein n=1 Tax=uncultured Dokdonia sp. TaxID=575653 RepID=UPI00260B030A|nr:helix-turn-helix domain-containing protein [uncultured Dokdonia sp.]
MNKRIAYSIISILIFTFSIKAQQEFQEDLIKLSFEELKVRINEHAQDSIKVVNYTDAFFLKAKKLKDTNNLARGYYYRKISGGKYKNRIDLYDSILALEKSLLDKNFIAIAYHDKGNFYYNQFHYDKALTNYLKSLSYLKNKKKEYLKFSLNLQIANIKLRIEQNEEALDILKKSYKIAQEKNYKEKYLYNYNRTLLVLSNAHRKLNHIDSALTYTKIGIQENKEKNDDFYYRFLLLEGILELNKVYTPSTISKIQKAITYLHNVNATTSIDQKVIISLAYYHIGLAHLNNNNYTKAIESFHQVDTTIGNSVAILPETIQGFHYLKEYYKKNENSEKALEYANKIISFDSIFNTHYKNIDKDIKKDFDIPFAVENANQKISKGYMIIIRISVLLVLIVTIILILQLVQKNKYKKRFKQLVVETTPQTTQIQSTTNNEKPAIPEEVFTKVKDCLELFEKEKQFLDKTINSTKLAKTIGTNGPYFSKAFKYLKNESFNVYLRNIRLDYALERLRNDKMFRKYTIKSIAHESGFNNPESFSKYFYKKYKIYPSFFIKQLDKVKENK